MQSIIISSLEASDSRSLSALLTESPADYVKHFHPFAFDAEAIYEQVRKARADSYFALKVVEDGGSSRLAGFYMLRGLDEGFRSPMYGVFIDRAYGGRGLARLTLAHAEAVCRLRGIGHLLLKVYPQNTRARDLYLASGFTLLRDDERTGQLILQKPLAVKSSAQAV